MRCCAGDNNMLERQVGPLKDAKVIGLSNLVFMYQFTIALHSSLVNLIAGSCDLVLNLMLTRDLVLN